MSTALVKMTGISRSIGLRHRLRQNAQPSMIGIIRSRTMNAGAAGNVVRTASASSPCRAPTVANPASSRTSRRASPSATSSSTTRTRGRLGSPSKVASELSESFMLRHRSQRVPCPCRTPPRISSAPPLIAFPCGLANSSRVPPWRPRKHRLGCPGEARYATLPGRAVTRTSHRRPERPARCGQSGLSLPRYVPDLRCRHAMSDGRGCALSRPFRRHDCLSSVAGGQRCAVRW